MTIQQYGQLPEDLDPSDVVRLANYASRITEHAGAALAQHQLQSEPPSFMRDFYVVGLDMCSLLSPEAVEFAGVEMAQIIADKVEPHKAAQLLQVVSDYYNDRKPLPLEVAVHEDITAKIATWAAISDVSQFVSAFYTRRIPTNDTRHIHDCLERSLAQNRLVKVFNASEATYQPSDPTDEQSRPSVELYFPPAEQRAQRWRAENLLARPQGQ